MPFCNGTDTGFARRESEPTSARSSMAREPEKPQSGGMQMTVSKRAVQAAAIDTGAPPAFYGAWDQIDYANLQQSLII